MKDQEKSKEEMAAEYQAMIDAYYWPKMQARLDELWRKLHALSKELDSVAVDTPLFARLKEVVGKEALDAEGYVMDYYRFLIHEIGCSFRLQNHYSPERRILSGGRWPRYVVRAEDWVNRPTEIKPWID